MAAHNKRVTKQPNGTWNYSCSCKQYSKTGLKFEASATTLHQAHVRVATAVAKAKK
jgi:hypothetical protein